MSYDIDLDVKGIAEAMRTMYDNAYTAYLPLVEDICSRSATEHEVDLFLDYLLAFAGEDRMLALFKRVCRTYLHQYPEAIVNHIRMWREMY